MRFPRMTTRRWLIVVAVAAVVLAAGEILRRRRSRFLERSLYHWTEGSGTADEIPRLPQRWLHVTPFRSAPTPRFLER